MNRLRRALPLAVAGVAVPSLLWLGIRSPRPLGVDAVTAATPGHVAVVGVAVAGGGAGEDGTSAQLVRHAAYRSGGLHKAIDPAATWILVRPGHVDMDSAQAARHLAVVRGLLTLLHGAAPQARIELAVGGVAGSGAAPSPALAGGLRDLADDPALAGLRVSVLDLARSEVEEAAVPDSGEGAAAYPVAVALLECDAVVNMARYAGPASGLANLEGLAGAPVAGSVDVAARLVDLALLAEVDFTVVDMLGPHGPLLLAGRDGVAVDRIAAELAGADSAAMAPLVRAGARRLGQAALGDIKVNGLDVEGTWTERADTAGAD